jgi:type I restriction enzyme R subunit
VRQFFSEGLAAGEVIDIFGIADKDRPEISVLSDEFLDSITKHNEHPNVQVRLLEKLLNDEIRGRMRANQMQAKLFSEEVRAVLQRYELKQLTSAEVVERLVEIAKQLRDARHRHEQLGLSEEEAAFYDALAGGVGDLKADPELAKIAHELVGAIRTDLTVDWADREATEARIRAKIKRLLRKHKYRPPKPRPNGGGGGDMRGFDYAAQLVLDQAKALYRYWPDVEVGERLFA